MAAYGASRPLPEAPAKVSSPSLQRSFGPGRGNRAITQPSFVECRTYALAQLRRFKHFLGSKYLRSLESTPEGRHYSGIGDAGAPAVIFGDGWAGSSSLSFFSNRLSSGSGSV